MSKRCKADVKEAHIVAKHVKAKSKWDDGDYELFELPNEDYIDGTPAAKISAYANNCPTGFVDKKDKYVKITNITKVITGVKLVNTKEGKSFWDNYTNIYADIVPTEGPKDEFMELLGGDNPWDKVAEVDTGSKIQKDRGDTLTIGEQKETADDLLTIWS